MSLRAISVSHNIVGYSEICDLINIAFPKNEQIPMWILHLLTLRKNVHFYAFYDEKQFCGILYTVENDKYIFVLYLAVNDKIRSKGYGSQIIRWLKSHTSKIIVLNVEALNSTASNAQQRERRIDFYNKNAISDTGCTFIDDGEVYSVLSSDGKQFDKHEYEIMLKRFSLGFYRSKIT